MEEMIDGGRGPVARLIVTFLKSPVTLSSSALCVSPFIPVAGNFARWPQRALYNANGLILMPHFV
ncbi:hypothetical protein BDV39DRAFT_173719 [Aspergillus sergii]|uniref:Uncharacterized protein n=1 Tax=Aspergillus sergii TaxID=1034303 RepID=A0A5N6X728_9EURO|nr:hypothetical protein BDV39DRAFT_173719 [Aspergillus sergii]